MRIQQKREVHSKSREKEQRLTGAVQTLFLEAPNVWESPSLDPRVNPVELVRQTLVLSLRSFLERNSSVIANPVSQSNEFLSFCNSVLELSAGGAKAQISTPSRMLCPILAEFCWRYQNRILNIEEIPGLKVPLLPKNLLGSIHGENSRELALLPGIRNHPEDQTKEHIRLGSIAERIGLRANSASFVSSSGIAPLLVPFVVSRGAFLSNVEDLLWNFGLSGVKRREIANERKKRLIKYAERLYDHAIELKGRLPPVPTGLGKVLKPLGERLRRGITYSMIARFAVNELVRAQGELDPRLSTVRDLRTRFGTSTGRAWTILKTQLTEEERELRKKIIAIQEKDGWTTSERLAGRRKIEELMANTLKQKAEGALKRLPTIKALIKQTKIPEDVFRKEMTKIEPAVLEEWRRAMSHQMCNLRTDSPRVTRLAEQLREEWDKFRTGELSKVLGLRRLMIEQKYHYREVKAALEQALTEDEIADREAVVKRQTREFRNEYKRKLRGSSSSMKPAAPS